MIDLGALSSAIPEAVRRRLELLEPEQLHAEAAVAIERQRAADHAALEADRAALAQRAAERKGVSVQLPKVYRTSRWPDVPFSCPAHEHVLHRVKQFAQVFGDREGLSMMFIGAPGNGKTRLACALANELADAGRSVAYTKANDIFARIKDGFGGRGETEAAVFNALAAPDLLIVDEVGRGHHTDAERTWLFGVIDRRYADGKSLVLISNLHGAALTSVLTTAGEDRIRERCRGHLWLHFTWPSFRTPENHKGPSP